MHELKTLSSKPTADNIQSQLTEYFKQPGAETVETKTLSTKMRTAELSDLETKALAENVLDTALSFLTEQKNKEITEYGADREKAYRVRSLIALLSLVRSMYPNSHADAYIQSLRYSVNLQSPLPITAILKHDFKTAGHSADSI